MDTLIMTLMLVVLVPIIAGWALLIGAPFAMLFLTAISTPSIAKEYRKMKHRYTQLIETLRGSIATVLKKNKTIECACAYIKDGVLQIAYYGHNENGAWTHSATVKNEMDALRDAKNLAKSARDQKKCGGWKDCANANVCPNLKSYGTKAVEFYQSPLRDLEKRRVMMVAEKISI